MPTQINVEYADFFIPFWSSAASVDVFAWATLGNDIVAGSQTVAFGGATRGVDMVTDLFNTIKNVLETLTGDVADTTYVPFNVFIGPTFGLAMESFGNFERMRPFVCIAAQSTYTWGLLNIPSRGVTENELAIPFKWNFRFEAAMVDSEQASPAYKEVMDYFNAEEQSPVLLVLELDPS